MLFGGIQNCPFFFWLNEMKYAEPESCFVAMYWFTIVLAILLSLKFSISLNRVLEGID